MDETKKRERIKEVIVVEGYGDVRAVKAAVDAELIVTSGFMISKATYDKIDLANKRSGVIVFTDPDFAGENIRKKISEKIKGVKHCFLPRIEATNESDGDIGIENASPESIRVALSKVRTLCDPTRKKIFANADLMSNGLIGEMESSDKRAYLGRILGIGYANGKQFLNRLNSYGITREEFEVAINNMNKEWSK